MIVEWASNFFYIRCQYQMYQYQIIWWTQNLNLNPGWHIELSILGLLHLSISIHLGNSSSCSMKFFHLKIALGLALRESWLLLAQTQKNTDVYRQPCINHLRDVNYCKSWERTPWHWSRPSWLFLTGCLSLHSWQTAMLAHVGTYWRMLALSFLHIHSLGQWPQWSCQVLSIENSPWANLGCWLFQRLSFSAQLSNCNLATRGSPLRPTEHSKITTVHVIGCSLRPSWLFHKGCLSLHSSQTAMLAHLDT